MKTKVEKRFAAFLVLYPLLFTAFLFALPTPKDGMPASAGKPTGASPFRPAGATFALTNVRVFDGESVQDRRTVAVEKGRVASMGDAPAPSGVQVLDGTGLTLLPGLIDAHTHVFGEAAKDALAFGVTTELDQFTDPVLLAGFRRQRDDLASVAEADVFSAGALATAPGGHGTEYGVKIPTLTRADEAPAWVDARIAEGSDWIKIVFDDGRIWGRTIPTIDRSILGAVIRAAHARSKKAVVHVSSLAAARAALEDGADGLVHVFADAIADDAFLTLAKERNAFVVPTLSVLDSLAGLGGGGRLKDDADLGPFLLAGHRQMLGATFPFSKKGEAFFATALENVRRLHAAGVPILAGTDASNPGTAHGASLHREMELLVKAGLTPLEALRSATSIPASRFGIPERGRIAPGLRADLVLVAGDPSADVRKTRAIVAIYRNGVFVPREVFDATRTSALLPEGTPGSFEDGTMKGGFGSGWQATTDQVRGGSSTAALAIVAGGAKGTAKGLEVSGEIKAGFPYPWAGAIFFPGTPPFAAVDASKRKELVFWARGDARTYRVLLFTTSGQIPSERTFAAPAAWTEVRLALDSFPGADPSGLKGIGFCAGAEPGVYRFDVDEVELR